MSGNVIEKAVVASILVLAAAGCSEQTADSTAAAKDAQPITERQPAPPTVRAYIDPKTGQFREPTPEELAAEAAADSQRKQAAAANKQSEQPESREVITPNGAIEITLDKAAQHPLQACIGKDGEVKVEHQADRQCEADSNGAKK